VGAVHRQLHLLVGLAAGGVMMVIPAYLYHDEEMHDVVIIGELLAIAAIVMCLMFVVGGPGPARPLLASDAGAGPVQLPDLDAHLGRDRAQRLPAAEPAHLRLPALHAVPGPQAPTRGGTCRSSSSRSSGRSRFTRSRRFSTAGLGGRPFWNTALLAPRFLASAFVSGPAFIIVAIHVMRRVAGWRLR
jgi:hypothetical protein